MPNTYRKRRVVTTLVSAIILIIIVLVTQKAAQQPVTDSTVLPTNLTAPLATSELEKLAVKGRSPETDYDRSQFGDGWTTINGCDTRNIILNRDLIDATVGDDCTITNGTLNDPYTGIVIEFKRGSASSSDVQIDHVVALSDAWQKGAQQLTRDQRIAFANDPLELLAVDGSANQQKSDGDAATWLPSYKPFRCQYVARQIAIKLRYGLWVTDAEKAAMQSVLSGCPKQIMPTT